MSQFSLVLIGRHENRDEPVAQALSAAFAQGVEWGRPVVGSAPIVLLDGLTESQGQAVHAALRGVEAAGCRFGVYPVGSPDVDGCSKLRWPTPPTINGIPLENYNQGAAPAVATGTSTAQISCPHCGGVFRISLNILSGTTPNSPRASNRQPSPSLGSPTPAPSLTSSGAYAPQSTGPATQVPVGYGVQGVGTSSGFYQLPGSNAMIGPVNPQSQPAAGPNTPPPQQGGMGGTGMINLPPAQPLPRARSVTPNPAQQPQPGLAPRPATPDRGQPRPSPQSGQRQISPGMGQPTGVNQPGVNQPGANQPGLNQPGMRPSHPTPSTGMVPPRRPNSGHYGKPDGTQQTPAPNQQPMRSPIELPTAQPLPTNPRPASNNAIPTLPAGAGGPDGTPAKALPPLDPTGGSEYSDLQGPMSLDEFEAHISGIHAPIEPPPTGGKKPPPPPSSRGNQRRPGPRR